MLLLLFNPQCSPSGTPPHDSIGIPVSPDFASPVWHYGTPPVEIGPRSSPAADGISLVSAVPGPQQSALKSRLPLYGKRDIVNQTNTMPELTSVWIG